MITKIRQFLADVALAGKSISWPARRELVDSTIVVIAFIVILAVVIMICDEAIRFALGQILSLGA